ncbi:T9SS type A sorting domain-containing protein [uncultured Fluviicola sp.]|uniref:T9SS type A sorting domain-containing protein n=1 Tax=uncultured Fluviicola sp. TaxID=463303 RepID=UPI0025EC28AC|nr:T9SS type A sorting domain-containing protein [uncultured Fluviicola sp.]
MKTLLLLFLLISSIGFTQNFTITDQHHYGTPGWDVPIKTIKCQDGGFLTIANSATSGNDKTQASFGGDDIWVIRLNADKTIRWEKTFGGDQDDASASVVELVNEDILILGQTNSGISGNKTSGNYGNSDFWLLKLDASGTKIWEKNFGSSDLDSPSSILVMSPTNYLITGCSSGGISGTKTVPGYGEFDIWCIGIDSSGNEVWQEAYGGDSYDGNGGLVKDAAYKLQNGNVLLLSQSNSGVSGVKTSPNYGWEDNWLIEINPSNGQLIQQNNFGGSASDYLTGILQIGNDIYLAGGSRSDVSGNKQSVLHGTLSAWLLKLDENLSVISDQSFGGTTYSGFGGGIIRTNHGFIASGGCRNDSNPWATRPVHGVLDIWIVGFDNSGNYQWNYSFGSATGSDGITDVIETSNNHYTVSFVSNPLTNDGDLTVPNYGSYDLYLVDLDTDLGVSNLSADQFSIFPNPAINSISINGINESAKYEITDLHGKIIESGDYIGVIDVNKFNAGLYTIRIVSDSQTITKKWIKN